MLSIVDTFGGPLRADPALGLPEPVLPTIKVGPLPKVQFVVEIAGPRTVLATTAAILLRADWQKALAEPQVWVMAPGDGRWNILGTTRNPSFDSLAMAWDMITATSRLSAQGTAELLKAAEPVAAELGRKAIAIPSPEQVDRLVTHWMVVRETLDIGFSIALMGAEPISEREIWRLCSAIGLQLSPQGSFDWVVDTWPSPLISVTPLEEERFSLGAVQLGVNHTGLSIGFNIPRCPLPTAAFDALLHVATQFETKYGCRLFTEGLEPLPDSEIAKLRSSLSEAIALIEKAGLSPGCAEAFKLFPA